MTLLIYWTLLYNMDMGAGWYIVGLVVWLVHVQVRT